MFIFSFVSQPSSILLLAFYHPLIHSLPFSPSFLPSSHLYTSYLFLDLLSTYLLFHYPSHHITPHALSPLTHSFIHLYTSLSITHSAQYHHEDLIHHHPLHRGSHRVRTPSRSKVGILLPEYSTLQFRTIRKAWSPSRRRSPRRSPCCQ